MMNPITASNVLKDTHYAQIHYPLKPVKEATEKAYQKTVYVKTGTTKTL